MEKINGNIWVETEYFGANIGIVKTSLGCVLIDTPMNPSDQDHLIKEVKNNELGEITWIITTDHHLDHFMGASFLPGKLISHHAVRGRFMKAFGPIEKIVKRVSWSDPKGAKRLRDFQIKEPLITFDGGLRLFFDRVTIHLKPFTGHTPHTICVRIEPEGVLFTGDNVVNSIPPFFHDAEEPLKWIDSLEAMKRLCFDILVPGHGKLAGREIIDEMIVKVQAVIDEVRGQLNSGMNEQQMYERIRYLTDFTDKQTENPALKEFYRQLEKRGVGKIIRALKQC
ncbi:MAG: MBL fold metallo-hydrolase [Deltaproteobacteria bacterium]|nr:MBL fold metallo-hydrolase [Deltaproteobacteria bacterium]MBW2150183.1 MBL fold metallo-hydrolase [Deltaproteobacteria bacterium]